MYKYLTSLPILLLIAGSAYAYTCPSGYLAVSRDNNTKIATPCPSDYTAMRTISHNCSATDSTCYPELLCTAGSYDLNVGSNTVPLWSKAITTPSLQIKLGDTTCYTPMAADVVSGRLKVKNTSGTTYSQANLYECKINLTSSGTNSYTAPSSNKTNWTSSLNGTNVSGISFCGNLNPNSVGTTADNITVDSVTMTNNIYCWCRITSPYISKWTYCTYFQTYGYTACYQSCNEACAGRMTGSGTYDKNFQNGILNSITR